MTLKLTVPPSGSNSTDVVTASLVRSLIRGMSDSEYPVDFKAKSLMITNVKEKPRWEKVKFVVIPITAGP
jgi:hypothetical protein